MATDVRLIVRRPEEEAALSAALHNGAIDATGAIDGISAEPRRGVEED